MRPSEMGLLLLAVATVVFVVAVASTSWWVFGAGLIFLLLSLFGVDPRMRARALPRKGLVVLLVALALLVALNALLGLFAPTDAAPGRGVSLGGPGMEFAAAFFMVAVAASVVVLFWVGLWRALETPRDAWRIRTYLVSLVLFVLAPAFIIGLELADPGAKLFEGLLYFLVADVAVAAALPHLTRAMLAGWGLGGEPATNDEAGNA